jgi:hypothetical protein
MIYKPTLKFRFVPLSSLDKKEQSNYPYFLKDKSIDYSFQSYEKYVLQQLYSSDGSIGGEWRCIEISQDIN